MKENNYILEKFKSAIKRGTGEAHFIMKAYPQVDFSKIIQKAAVKNGALDTQVEGTRAEYIIELVNLSQKKEILVDSILKALSKERKDSRVLSQLFDFAKTLAVEGNREAKKAIYRRFYKKIIPGCSDFGEDAIIELDGIEGLKYVAITKGKAFMQNSEKWEDDSLITSFTEMNPTINANLELKKAAKNNSYIKKYLEVIKNTHDQRSAYKESKADYSTVNNIIKSQKSWRIPPPLSKKLKNNDVLKLAKDFLNAVNDYERLMYLSIFEIIKFPYDYHAILEIAKRRYNKKTRLTEFAINSLKFFKARDIREFAIDILKRTKEPMLYTDLLIGNYKAGDYKTLKSLINRTNYVHHIHTLAYSYIHIYETNKTQECKEPLEALYGKLTCGNCRNKIIKILIENKVLPNKIKKEIQYDSYTETRKLNTNLK